MEKSTNQNKEFFKALGIVSVLLLVEISFFLSFFIFIPLQVNAQNQTESVRSELIVGNVYPELISVSIDDGNESIDLIPNSTKMVNCSAVIRDFNGEGDIKNVTAKFFDDVSSNPDASDDNNNHYSNSSCNISTSYGDAYEVLAICLFDVWYYANNATWNCNVTANDTYDWIDTGNDTILMNTLLALDVPPTINYGTVNATYVSNQNITNVTNYGNVAFNLTLDGYGAYDGDGMAMNCTLGAIKNISIGYERYNLTNSTTGSLTLEQFGQTYVNLTDTPTVKRFDLNQRQNDALNEAWNATYWRIYVPKGVAGTCSGIINFAAIQSDGS